MSDIAILSTVLGSLGAICAIIFGYSAWKRAHKIDDTGIGEKNGTILTEIGYIKSGVDDIKAEQREQRSTNTQFHERLTAVEESTKQAHKRIDRVEVSLRGE